MNTTTNHFTILKVRDVGTSRLAVLIGIVLLTACIPAPVRRTPGVTGRVLDSRTRAPVAGARIAFIDFPTVNTLSGQNGHFALAPTNKFGIIVLLPYDPGQWYLPLEVRHAGYRPLQTKVPFYDFGSPHPGIDYSLEPIR